MFTDLEEDGLIKNEDKFKVVVFQSQTDSTRCSTADTSEVQEQFFLLFKKKLIDPINASNG